MTIRIGLMGFGRIGRNIFRILHHRDDIQVAAISDVADFKNLEYLLKYDTIMGRFPDTISVEEGHLYSKGRQIKLLPGRDPGDVNWAELEVDVVIEATSRSRSHAEASLHLERGAKRVILCAPPSDAPDRTVVFGLNHQDLTPNDKIVSNSSITSHCAGLLIKLIDDAFGIERLFFSSIHAYTNEQRLADVPAAELRRSRAAHENIIPTETRSVDVLEQLFPHLRTKLSGLAVNVPIPDGSLVDMVTFTRKPISATAVNQVVRTASDSIYKGLVEYVTDPIVSSDVTSSSYSSIFDSLGTLTLGNHIVKTISWFNNGWGYAHRVIDLIEHMDNMEGGLS